MKYIQKLLVAMVGLWSMSASASLITVEPEQDSYLDGDIVTMDVFVNGADPDMAWLGFNLQYDSFGLDPIWDVDFLSSFNFLPSVVSNTSNSVVIDYLGDVDFFMEFNSDWADNLSASRFQLGSLSFSAMGDFPLLDVSISNVDVAVDAQVPEPESMALMLAGLGLLLYRKKKAAK